MEHTKAIQSALKEAGLGAILFTDPISCRYATGFYFTDGAVLVSENNSWLITDSRYTEAAGMQVKESEVLAFHTGNPLKDQVAELCKGISGALGAEEDRMSFAEWKSWETKLGRELTPAGSLLTTLRAVKDADEVESMIEAQRIAEKALEDVLNIIRPGLTEKEIAAELTYRMLKYGGEENSFDPIVVTGAKSSMPHGVPGDVVIAEGDFVTMDFGTKKNGYCSDMTRTVAVGHATEEMEKVYATVLRAQLAGIAAAKAGVEGCVIDGAARKVIADAGYGDCFGHSFGHSLGLEIHEMPGASPTSHVLLPEGLAVSAEPGIYLPGRFGVRIEDVIILTADGCRNITKAPKELLVL